MSAVTISKREYRELVGTKLRFEYLRQLLKEDIFTSPPTRSIREVVKSFRATGKYTRGFLKSLEKGLGRSSYFRKA